MLLIEADKASVTTLLHRCAPPTPIQVLERMYYHLVARKQNTDDILQLSATRPYMQSVARGPRLNKPSPNFVPHERKFANIMLLLSLFN
jgi:hypothetical protein